MTDSPLQFPGEHPLKVMGRNSAEFRERTIEVLSTVRGFSAASLQERPSRDGTYVSLSCTLYVDTREQLDAIYRQLHATGLVLYAL